MYYFNIENILICKAFACSIQCIISQRILSLYTYHKKSNTIVTFKYTELLRSYMITCGNYQKNVTVDKKLHVNVDMNNKYKNWQW